jgi:diadenosine tetraphosphate (Ap4A) HIT family hydrolase
MTRKRRNHLKSLHYIRAHNHENQGCPFCAGQEFHTVIEATSHMLVIENHIPYDVFEGGAVESHYMVIPRQHRARLADFTSAERREYIELIAKYEDADYNSYTRSTQSKTRSLEHYHTHLLRTPSGTSRWMLYIERPYILLFKRPNKYRKT